MKNPLHSANHRTVKQSAFRRISDKIESRDVFLLLGLCFLGVGLYFWFGRGPSLTGLGVVITILGIFGK